MSDSRKLPHKRTSSSLSSSRKYRETEIIIQDSLEMDDSPYSYCEIPPHFFERALQGIREAGLEISVEKLDGRRFFSK